MNIMFSFQTVILSILTLQPRIYLWLNKILTVLQKIPVFNSIVKNTVFSSYTIYCGNISRNNLFKNNSMHLD